jgi:hypothetical protein
MGKVIVEKIVSADGFAPAVAGQHRIVSLAGRLKVRSWLL